jgi:CheY-like chemotaxis protein
MSKKKFVMIVEDDPALGQMIKESLSDALGVDAVFVESFAEACDRLEHMETVPDLFVVDVSLADGDGRELLTDLFLGRFGTAAGSSPVIVCSGQVRESDITAWGALSNFAGFLAKPFHPTELTNLANTALATTH